MLRHCRNRGSRSTESANPARPIWVKSAILLGVAARSQLIIAPGRLPLTAICIRGEEKVRTQFLSPTNIRIRCLKAENVRLQFLSLRHPSANNVLRRALNAYKSPITTAFARKPPHCAELAETRNSLSRPVFLQTSRLRGFSTVFVNI